MIQGKEGGSCVFLMHSYLLICERVVSSCSLFFRVYSPFLSLSLSLSFFLLFLSLFFRFQFRDEPVHFSLVFRFPSVHNRNGGMCVCVCAFGFAFFFLIFAFDGSLRFRTRYLLLPGKSVAAPYTQTLPHNHTGTTVFFFWRRFHRHFSLAHRVHGCFLLPC